MTSYFHNGAKIDDNHCFLSMIFSLRLFRATFILNLKFLALPFVSYGAQEKMTSRSWKGWKKPGPNRAK